MKTKRRALADYIAKFASHFACGCTVKPDGSNVQFSIARRRDGAPCWRLRCLDHNRQRARDAMFLLRLERMES